MDMADSARDTGDTVDKRTATLTLDTEREKEEDVVVEVVGIEGNSRFVSHGGAAVNIISSSKSHLSADTMEKVIENNAVDLGTDGDNDDNDDDKMEKTSSSSSSYVDFSEAMLSVQGACPFLSSFFDTLTFIYTLTNMSLSLASC